jgi:hypothetical protein
MTPLIKIIINNTLFVNNTSQKLGPFIKTINTFPVVVGSIFDNLNNILF